MIYAQKYQTFQKIEFIPFISSSYEHIINDAMTSKFLKIHISKKIKSSNKHMGIPEFCCSQNLTICVVWEVKPELKLPFGTFLKEMIIVR